MTKYITNVEVSMKSLITYFVENGTLIKSTEKYYSDDECIKINELKDDTEFNFYKFNDVSDILLYFNDIL